MRPPLLTLAVTALVAGLPAWAQRPPATDRPTREPPPEVTKSKPKPIDAGVSLSGQSDARSDVKLTDLVRKAVLDDKRLSFAAKNVKITSRGGEVTLRGEVETNLERTIVREHAMGAAGPYQVVDELTVKGNTLPTN